MPQTIFEKLAIETIRLKTILPANYVTLVEQAIQKHAQVVQMLVNAAERQADRV